MGCSPRGLKASDTTEQACMHTLTVQLKDEGTATPRRIPAKFQRHHGKRSQNTVFTILRGIRRKTAKVLKLVTSEKAFTKTGRDDSEESCFSVPALLWAFSVRHLIYY